MNLYVKNIENRLSDEDKLFLKQIYAPTVVSVPLENAAHSFCVLSDGTIREYGKKLSCNPKEFDCHGNGLEVYRDSTDGGLTFKMHIAKPEKAACHRAFKCPVKDYYVSYGYTPKDRHLYVRTSKNGSEDENFEETVAFAETCQNFRTPLYLEKYGRWLFFGEVPNWDTNHAVICYSDDDCKTFKTVHIKQTPQFKKEFPHQGMRWGQYGIEPSVAELSDGSLYMLLRTSEDYFYECRSVDGGASWSDPVRSIFHGVDTMPLLFKLNDGRLLVFFNNTRPMPEQNPDGVWPPLYEWEVLGRAEDVFTNRDANCVAISEDDGKTWKGFRELNLNLLRNTCDFRTSGTGRSSSDKSVHQFEAIELPFNKVFVSVGQHERLRKNIIFDLDWLYEDKRIENFTSGFDNVTTHVWLKSVSGNCRGDFPGHCAWNRTNGCVPVPDPSGNYSEAILFKNTDDDRLLNQIQGMVWNFPAANKAKLTVKLRVMGNGLKINICDHQISPSDKYVSLYGLFEYEATDKTVGEELYDTYEFIFDTNKKICEVLKNGNLKDTVKMKNPAPHGACYLHLQTVTEEGDNVGTFLKRMEMQKL